MNESLSTHCTAFEGDRCLASGALKTVAAAVKSAIDHGSLAPVLVFDDATSALIELDLRGTPGDVVQRLGSKPDHNDAAHAPRAAATPAHRGPGRPRLGVVAREVTLLPRHWDWLALQPGGASVALRRLVDEARHTHAGKDRVRQAQESAYRFISAIAGHRPGFEEATRALFAGDAPRFAEQVRDWPVDVRRHAQKLARAAFEGARPAVDGSAA